MNFDALKNWLSINLTLEIITGVSAMLALAWLADFISKKLLLRWVAAFARRTETNWDDAVIARRTFNHLAHIAPAAVLYAGCVLIPDLAESAISVIRKIAAAYIVLTLLRAAYSLLDAFNDVHQQSDKAKIRPIKGYVQLGKIALTVIAAIVMIALLIERSPLLLLSGLGAMTAVMMLVFKDTILSFVASIQLGSNDMLRVGDWIEMPSAGADGDVIDIALHTVKVQNFDKTITSIPTWRMINESYKNWRGMSESGGRRIKRALWLDISSVRFLAAEEVGKFKRFALLKDYIDGKQAEVDSANAKLDVQLKDHVNLRRLTNVGTFRAYIKAYLQNHPNIHQQKTILVRQQDATATGLPMEIYCFTDTTEWLAYESIRSDIFDHLFAILPEFGLRVFQQPSGSDFREFTLGKPE